MASSSITTRIKIHFDSPLSEKDSLSYLYLIPSSASTVQDVADSIVADFSLQKSCKNGIRLLVDGYCLPFSQPSCLIRDGDNIQVQKVPEKSVSKKMEKNVKKQVLDMQHSSDSSDSESSESSEGKSQENVAVITKKGRKVGLDSKKGLLQEKGKIKNKKVLSKFKDSGLSESDQKVKKSKDGKNNKKRKAPDNSPAKSVEDDKKDKMEVSSEETEDSSEEDSDAKGDSNQKKEREGPSRSARRKKAKRQWLKKLKGENKNLTEVSQVASQTSPQFSKPPKGAHFRFTEEGDQVEVEPKEPSLKLKPLASKRQGQNWGQEKNFSGQWPGKNFEENQIESPEKGLEIEPVTEEQKGQEEAYEEQYKRLPALMGEPKAGDIIAYRLVELSPSFTPELSSFREGQVVSFDRSSGALTLNPTEEFFKVVFKTPEGFPEPYSEEGVLQTEIDSLTDIRLAHSSSSPNFPLPPPPAPSPLGGFSLAQPQLLWGKLLANQEGAGGSPPNSPGEKVGGNEGVEAPSLDLGFLVSKRESPLTPPHSGGKTPANTPIGPPQSGVKFLENTPISTPQNGGKTPANTPHNLPFGGNFSAPNWSNLKAAIDKTKNWSPGRGGGNEGENEGEQAGKEGEGVEKGEEKREEISATWAEFADISGEIEKRKEELQGNGEKGERRGSFGGSKEEKKWRGKTWRSGGIGPTLALLRAGKFDGENGE